MTFQYRKPNQYMVTGEYDGRAGVWNFSKEKWEGRDSDWLNLINPAVRREELFTDGRCTVSLFGYKAEAYRVVESQSKRGIVITVRSFPTWVACRMVGMLPITEDFMPE